jgi:hypothetical protein
MMTTEIVTVIAAIIAALTSIGSLLLNTRLAIRKEQRMLLWGKELDRLAELEEMAGIAQELALSYANPQVLEVEFKPIHDKLRHSAGRFGRYPDLAKSIRELNYCCAVTVAEKVKSGDSREWQEKIKPAFHEFIRQCDLVTKRNKT